MTPHPGEDAVFQGAPTLAQATKTGQLAYGGSLIWAGLLEAGVIALVIAGRSVTEHRFALVMAAAYAPVLVIVGGMNALWRLPPFRWLYVFPLPFAVLRAEGIELHMAGEPPQRYAWSDVWAMSAQRRNGTADLLGADGRPLTRIPASLVMGRRGELAGAVVACRPDLFELGSPRLRRTPRTFRRRDRNG